MLNIYKLISSKFGDDASIAIFTDNERVFTVQLECKLRQKIMDYAHIVRSHMLVNRGGDHCLEDVTLGAVAHHGTSIKPSVYLLQND